MVQLVDETFGAGGEIVESSARKSSSAITTATASQRRDSDLPHGLDPLPYPVATHANPNGKRCIKRPTIHSRLSLHDLDWSNTCSQKNFIRLHC
jgi:hypothetical protein